MNRLPAVEDDGLLTPVVGAWAEQKYLLLHNYAGMFATSMKRKWKHRVYIDLFADAGRARLRGSNRIVPASPLLALMVADPFDRCIFCEMNDARIRALEVRCEREYPDVDTRFVRGDSNQRV